MIKALGIKTIKEPTAVVCTELVKINGEEFLAISKGKFVDFYDTKKFLKKRIITHGYVVYIANLIHQNQDYLFLFSKEYYYTIFKFNENIEGCLNNLKNIQQNIYLSGKIDNEPLSYPLKFIHTKDWILSVCSNNIIYLIRIVKNQVEINQIRELMSYSIFDICLSDNEICFLTKGTDEKSYVRLYRKDTGQNNFSLFIKNAFKNAYKICSFQNYKLVCTNDKLLLINSYAIVEHELLFSNPEILSYADYENGILVGTRNGELFYFELEIKEYHDQSNIKNCNMNDTFFGLEKNQLVTNKYENQINLSDIPDTISSKFQILNENVNKIKETKNLNILDIDPFPSKNKKEKKNMNTKKLISLKKELLINIGYPIEKIIVLSENNVFLSSFYGNYCIIKLPNRFIYEYFNYPGINSLIFKEDVLNFISKGEGINSICSLSYEAPVNTEIIFKAQENIKKFHLWNEFLITTHHKKSIIYKNLIFYKEISEIQSYHTYKLNHFLMTESEILTIKIKNKVNESKNEYEFIRKNLEKSLLSEFYDKYLLITTVDNLKLISLENLQIIKIKNFNHDISCLLFLNYIYISTFDNNFFIFDLDFNIVFYFKLNALYSMKLTLQNVMLGTTLDGKLISFDIENIGSNNINNQNIKIDILLERNCLCELYLINDKYILTGISPAVIDKNLKCHKICIHEITSCNYYKNELYISIGSNIYKCISTLEPKIVFSSEKISEELIFQILIRHKRYIGYIIYENKINSRISILSKNHKLKTIEFKKEILMKGTRINEKLICLTNHENEFKNQLSTLYLISQELKILDKITMKGPSFSLSAHNNLIATSHGQELIIYKEIDNLLQILSKVDIYFLPWYIYIENNYLLICDVVKGFSEYFIFDNNSGSILKSILCNPMSYLKDNNSLNQNINDLEDNLNNLEDNLNNLEDDLNNLEDDLDDDLNIEFDGSDTLNNDENSNNLIEKNNSVSRKINKKNQYTIIEYRRSYDNIIAESGIFLENYNIISDKIGNLHFWNNHKTRKSNLKFHLEDFGVIKNLENHYEIKIKTKYNYQEPIISFTKGSLSLSKNINSTFFSTKNGSIGIIFEINIKYLDILKNLQKYLKSKIILEFDNEFKNSNDIEIIDFDLIKDFYFLDPGLFYDEFGMDYKFVKEVVDRNIDFC